MGDFKDNKACGNGYCETFFGDKYEGQFENNVPNGLGLYISAFGDEKYSGDFSNGKKHGWGKLERKGKMEYEGFFKEGLFHGMGTYRR